MLGLLFAVLIVFAAMWLAVPWLQRSTMSGDEGSAVATLRSIHAAQKEMYGASRMYGSMGKLSNSKLIAQSQDSFSVKGYEFYHSAAPTGRTWCAVAIPEMDTQTRSVGQPTRKSGKNFGIDEAGTVYQDVSPSACYAGTLNTNGAAALK
jgi:hypothetical protein